MNHKARYYASDIYAYWAKGTYLYGKWAADHGVNYYEMLVLYALHDRGSLTQKLIGESYGMPKQTVHNVIKTLKDQGYLVLTAGEQDKREKAVSFTASGELYARQILEPLFRAEERVCKSIPEEQLQQMIQTAELFNLLFEKEWENEHE